MPRKKQSSQSQQATKKASNNWLDIISISSKLIVINCCYIAMQFSVST